MRTATFPIHYTESDDAPLAVADVNDGVVVEAGIYGPGNPTATGAVLTNDSDPEFDSTLHHDTIALQGVAAGTLSGPVTGNVGATVTGTYGRLVLAADGHYTYTLDNNDPDTNALAEFQHATDVFTYTIADNFGASATTTLSIRITGARDAGLPVALPDTNASDPVIEGSVSPLIPDDPTAQGDLLANDLDFSGVGSPSVVEVTSSAHPFPLAPQFFGFGVNSDVVGS